MLGYGMMGISLAPPTAEDVNSPISFDLEGSLQALIVVSGYRTRITACLEITASKDDSNL